MKGINTMMTRKHYKELAVILSNHTVSNELIKELCEFLKRDNSRFQASTFIYYYQDLCKSKPLVDKEFKLTDKELNQHPQLS